MPFWDSGAHRLWFVRSRLRGPTTRKWPPKVPKVTTQKYKKPSSQTQDSNKKTFSGRKTLEKCEKKTEKGFKKIHYSWKNCEKHATGKNMFLIQTNMAACEMRHMSISIFRTVLVWKTPNTLTWRQKWFFRLKKSGFCFIVEWRQPYYGPFMESDWP